MTNENVIQKYFTFENLRPGACIPLDDVAHLYGNVKKVVKSLTFNEYCYALTNNGIRII